MELSRWQILAVLGGLSLTACGVGHGQVADSLYWGVIAQSRIYVEPNDVRPGHAFLIEFETVAGVDHIEFATPGGWAFTIPGDAYVVSGDVETYHELWDGFDVWGYWAIFDAAASLADYGDGMYVVTLHFPDGSVEQTDVWYGIPDADYAMARPVQEPHLTAPPYDGATASPVVFTWDACTDPNVYDLYLAVTDANSQAVVDEIFEPNATGSDAYPLDEGWYDVEFVFENFWPIYNADDVPFDLIKANVSMHQFEVVYADVYRFWSPVTSRHFYTAKVSEKDKLINLYAHVWTYEGVVFHANTTAYYPDLVPVYRFWSDTSSSHFYTISEREKDKLIDRYAHVWNYEGIAFYAYRQEGHPVDTRAVHRFWKPADNSHFYTMSEREKNKVMNKYGHIYRYEGIAYYTYE